MLCCCYDKSTGKTLVGTSRGHLQVWTGASCSKKDQIPIVTKGKKSKRGVDAIWVNEDYIITGSRDFKINILLNKKYKRVNSIDLRKLIPDALAP